MQGDGGQRAEAPISAYRVVAKALDDAAVARAGDSANNAHDRRQVEVNFSAAGVGDEGVLRAENEGAIDHHKSGAAAALRRGDSVRRCCADIAFENCGGGEAPYAVDGYGRGSACYLGADDAPSCKNSLLATLSERCRRRCFVSLNS